jgi:predicted DNA-binding protein
MGATHKTTLYLPSDLQRRLREHARRTGAPQAAIVREALERYLADAPRPVLASLGVGEDEELDASEARAWLRARWENEHA